MSMDSSETSEPQQQYRLTDDAPNHYHNGEPVGPNEAFVPSERELALFGDKLIPVARDTEERVNDEPAGDADEVDAVEEAPTPAEGQLEDLSRVGESKADALREAGYETISDLQAAPEENIAAADGISDSLAASIKEQVGEE